LQEFIPDVKEAEYVLCKICFGDLK